MHIELPSLPSSPHSSALPSPPDSPNSVSSLPSLNSSFFLSSADVSPPHPATDVARDSTAGLVIPSLTLPPALSQPTAYGKTLADLRLIVLGGSAEFLLDGNKDIVDVAQPEAAPLRGARIIRASTDWIEHSDGHGLDRFEPSHNVEILEIARSGGGHDMSRLTEQLLNIVHAPFREVHDLLDPTPTNSALLSNLVSSPTSPLYTAFIVLSSGLSTQERSLIAALGTAVPVIILPPVAGTHTRVRLPLSTFRPQTPVALRTALFRAPDTLATLRTEAADRFFAWREREMVAARPRASSASWDKSAWEADWAATMSRAASRRAKPTTGGEPAPPCVPLDPLHLPSLLAFSLSLFTPTRERLRRISLTGRGLGLALLGTLCVGIGLGLGMALRLPAFVA
ncbi:unnamed protein product [Peniophora sp. CBMAI 1063]|nr:unnamed protein product [Peniophora sp. CBMAI 1063]